MNLVKRNQSTSRRKDTPASADWNGRVREALERTDIMALSTLGPDGSWTTPVQYRYNEKLELSFVSMMDTKHVANILKDSRVSVAIYNPTQLPGGGSLGLQIKGAARLVSRADEAGWHAFTIAPEEVWCFDSRISRKRKRIDVTRLKL
jgi:pyridoxamine 5'-phosphate oxidase-like protein